MREYEKEKEEKKTIPKEKRDSETRRGSKAQVWSP